MDQIQKTNPLSKFKNQEEGFQTISFKEKQKNDISLYKIRILDFLNLFFAGFFSFYLYRYLNNFVSFWIVLFFGVLFLTVIIFEAALNLSWPRRFIVIVIETILFFYFFFQKEIINIILILALAFLILRFWGEFQTKRNFKNSLEIKFLKFTKPTFSTAISAILLVFISFYILNFKENQIFISPHFFDNCWKIFSRIYNMIYPEINLSGSLNDFIKSFVILNFKDKKSSFLRDFSPEEQEQILNELTLQAQKDFLKKFNLENTDPNKSLKEIVYFNLENKLENWHQNFGFYFLVLWAITLFIIGYGLSLFFRIFLNIWLFIIFEVFLALGFISIGGQPKTQEVLNF